MCLRCLKITCAARACARHCRRRASAFVASCIIILSLSSSTAPAASTRELRVCSDPNNLPFSNDRSEGFENRIAELIVRDLQATLHYTWWAQRRGFLRNTLNAGKCDVVMGYPPNYAVLRSTRPYYRSSYVFVQRAGVPPVKDYDDPALRSMQIGVQLIGDDGANTPPVEALAKRGIIAEVERFSLRVLKSQMLENIGGICDDDDEDSVPQPTRGVSATALPPLTGGSYARFSGKNRRPGADAAGGNHCAYDHRSRVASTDRSGNIRSVVVSGHT